MVKVINKNIVNNIRFSPKFKELSQTSRLDYINYIYYGGRDSTKSWTIAYHLLIKAMTEKGHLILCAKGTQNSIDDSSKSLLEKLININKWDKIFTVTNKEIVCILTGSRFIFKGLQNVNRLRSLEGITVCWIEEANIDTTAKTFEALIPTIRQDNSILILSFNPLLDTDYVYQRFVLNPDTELDFVQKVTYTDNKFLSEKSKREIAFLKNKNHEKYLHIYGGNVVTEIQGALWTRDIIAYLNNEERKEILDNNFLNLEKIVVSLDPSTTSKMTSDACGIIVAGKYKNQDRYIILEDASRIATPNEWSDIAIALYHKYKANYIVGEINQGGDMIKTIINNKDKRIPYKGVRASKGKIARAEPISYLYEEGKVVHYRPFPNLEYEYVTFTGLASEASPNSLDSAVWALTQLSTGTKQMSGYAVVNPANSNIRF